MSNPGGWNYRVVHLTGVLKAIEIEVDYYQIHSVYYTNNVPDSMSKDGISIGGDDRNSFVQDINYQEKAMYMPVLVWDVATEKFTGEEDPILIRE